MAENRKLDVVDQQGKKVGDVDLNPAVWGVPVNAPVMHQVVVAGRAAARRGTQSTKTRAEVRGGGRKPWRQKGTGRARHGSIRSPIWSGGGVAHGPKPRDYSMRVNKKMKRLALRSALSDRAAEGRILALDSLTFSEPSTKEAIGVLESVDASGAVLLVLGSRDEAVEKSFRNLPYVKVVLPALLSTYDVLYADTLVFTRDALEMVKP